MSTNKSGLSDGVKSPWTPDKMFDFRPFLEILGRVIVKLNCVSGFWGALFEAPVQYSADELGLPQVCT